MVAMKSLITAIAGSMFTIYSVCAPAAPVQEKSGNVTVMHGGIGLDDRAAIERAAEDYNLRLKFAHAGSGEYLADVRVVVSDAKGSKVLESVSSGPFWHARLSPGDYSVAATVGGTTLTHKVSIAQGGWRGWVFRFDLPASK
jgi:hypothetical protein